MPRNFTKLRLAYKLLMSQTYIILLDGEAALSVPISDLDDLDNIILVSSQNKVLRRMQTDLEMLIRQHDNKISQLTTLEEN